MGLYLPIAASVFQGKLFSLVRNEPSYLFKVATGGSFKDERRGSPEHFSRLFFFFTVMPARNRCHNEW